MSSPDGDDHDNNTDEDTHASAGDNDLATGATPDSSGSVPALPRTGWNAQEAVQASAAAEKLVGEDVRNTKADHQRAVWRRHEDRLRQASLFRQWLFWTGLGTFGVLTLAEIGLAVILVLGVVSLSAAVAISLLGGLTVQVVSILLVISRSVFPATDTDFKINDPDDPQPKDTRDGEGQR